MPRLRDYTAEPVSGLPPVRNATPGDFGNDGMARFGEAGMSTAQVLDQKASQDDVTNVRVAMAKARSEWDVHLRERSAAAKPGDPTFADKFTQDFKDYLGKARDIAQTRDGQRTFDLLSADLTGHFTEKAGVFQVQSAGVKARQDWDVAQRAYATSVSTDPTSYSSVLGQALAELRDPNGVYGKMDGANRQALEAKARDTLAQSYIFGLQNMKGGGPELALKILTEGRLDDQLDPKDKQRLIRTSEQAITAERVAAEHAEALARKAEKDRVAQTNDGLMGDYVAGKLTMDKVRASGLPAFGEGSQATWIGMLKQQTKELTEKPAKTTASVFNDLRERIDLPPGDPRKITDREDIWKLFGKGLSEADAFRLERRFVDARSEGGQRWAQAETEFIKNIRPQLDKSTMNSLDTGGGERVQAFSVYLREKADEARKNGKDPYALLNPTAPEYIGKEIRRFQTPPQQLARDIADRIDAANKKTRLPGESPADYLKRMGR